MDRFWSKVAVGDRNACWPWLAAVNMYGYGVFRLADKQVKAHRLAWILTNGEIPESLVVCHRCDNPPCCNPHHHFLGTKKENTQDCIKKGRFRRGYVKLTSDQVVAIRAASGTGASIAAMYGVSKAHVNAIRAGRRYSTL